MFQIVRDIPSNPPRAGLPVTLALGAVLAQVSVLGRDLWDGRQPAWVLLIAPVMLLAIWCGALAMAARSAFLVVLTGWLGFALSLRLGAMSRVRVPLFQVQLSSMWTDGLLYAIGSGVLVVVGLAASAGAWGVARLFISPAGEAPRCWRCRYDRAGLPGDCVCPECAGAATAPMTGLASWLGRRGVSGLGWAVCILAAGWPVVTTACRFVSDTLPRQAAATRFGEILPGWRVPLPHALSRPLAGVAVRPIGGDDRGMLVLEVLEAGSHDPVAARIYFGLRVDDLPSPPGPYRPAATLFYCNLSASQLLALDAASFSRIEALFLAKINGRMMEPLGCEVMTYDILSLPETFWTDHSFSGVFEIEAP